MHGVAGGCIDEWVIGYIEEYTDKHTTVLTVIKKKTKDIHYEIGTQTDRHRGKQIDRHTY